MTQQRACAVYSTSTLAQVSPKPRAQIDNRDWGVVTGSEVGKVVYKPLDDRRCLCIQGMGTTLLAVSVSASAHLVAEQRGYRAPSARRDKEHIGHSATRLAS